MAVHKRRGMKLETEREVPQLVGMSWSLEEKKMSEEKPVWEFERVELTYLTPIIKEGVKSTKTCYASIDFGFFIVTDIGITRHEGDDLSWNPDFGWSSFHFKDSHIDNPYGGEVRKLEMLVKEELDRKRPEIISFLHDPNTMPEDLRTYDQREKAR